ncbi:VOC family protein [Neobacillus soli]|uniref:VOC family protein n=1 Tax=Neobacillus soli TaxID=220688 RepID=UPI0008246043|nr:VOC family protein [Neobacillus soli]
MDGKKIDHVGVMVKDLDASITFYQDVVGMKLKDKFTIANGAKTLAFLGFTGSDETELELIYGSNDNFPAEGRVNHFAITVEDIEAEFERLKGLDVQFIHPEISTLPNGYRNFFVHGPNCEKVEFFQR